DDDREKPCVERQMIGERNDPDEKQEEERPRGVELGAGDAPARSQDVVEAGLDSLLLEVGLDDARGRVDRSTGRLVDDPADVASGELLLRPGRGTQWRDAPRRRGAERGAGGVA